jgi:hypothetical protein
MFKVLMKISMNLVNAVVSAESHSWNKQQFGSFWRKTIWTGLTGWYKKIPV